MQYISTTHLDGYFYDSENSVNLTEINLSFINSNTF